MLIRQHTNIFGTHTPWYGICVCLSLLATVVWILYGFKRHRMNEDQQNELLIGFPFVVLFGGVVAFVLDAVFTGDWRTWLGNEQRRFGFTYAGWLLGALVAIWVHGRATSFGAMFLLNYFSPVFALTQGIGRIGCLLSGCCYGKVCKWGVKYPPGSFPFERVGDACVFPVQLVEALLLVCLFAICLKSVFRFRAVVYLVGVAGIRFVLEFFRGDNRGSIVGVTCLSPQQFMSVAFLLVGLFILIATLMRERFGHG